MIRVGVIGLGLIGQERLAALDVLRRRGRDLEVIGVLDPHDVDAREQAARAGIAPAASVDDLVARDPDWLVVATPHDVATELVARLLPSGIAILIEKPLGRSSAEAAELVRARRRDDQLWVGLNYRFYAGVAALLHDVREDRFGPLVSMTATLGHGGAPGMEKSWKLDPTPAGGGALIDPGIHLLDLCLAVAGGDLEVVGGTAWNGFWKTGVEEECHLVLRGGRLPAANVQVSIVRWRSVFRLEVHGTEGYGIVDGRSRSYGGQTYRRGRRWGWRSGRSQADSEDCVTTSDGTDVFVRELEALFYPSAGAIRPCGADEALRGMRLLDACRVALGIPLPDVARR